VDDSSDDLIEHDALRRERMDRRTRGRRASPGRDRAPRAPGKGAETALAAAVTRTSPPPVPSQRTAVRS